MGTMKRIQLSVEPEIYELVRALAEETDSSMSGLVAEYLMEVAPILEKNLQVLRMAKQVRDKGRERVTSHLESTLKIMEEELEQMQKAYDSKVQ